MTDLPIRPLEMRELVGGPMPPLSTTQAATSCTRTSRVSAYEASHRSATSARNTQALSALQRMPKALRGSPLTNGLILGTAFPVAMLLLIAIAAWRLWSIRRAR
jgi:hypothetical protein